MLCYLVWSGVGQGGVMWRVVVHGSVVVRRSVRCVLCGVWCVVLCGKL